MTSTETGEDEVIEMLEVEQFTCLLIGESRTGKSTFMRLLRNMNYKTNLEVWRGTVDPVAETMLAKVNGKYMSIEILDTPGFGEVATTAARCDNKLRSMITEFVKRDVCKLSMVCIAIKGDGGLTAAQISHITSSIQFLGEEAAARACFLVTHFENRTEEDEKAFIEAFTSNPNMEFLNMAVQGGFLFTGAINETQHKNVAVRDAFLLQQRRRTREFFDLLTQGSPIELRSPEMAQARSMFAVQESVLTSCTSLQQLVPEVKSTWARAMDTRIKLSAILAEGKLDDDKAARAKTMIDKLEKLGASDAAPVVNDRVPQMLAEYERIGTEVRQSYEAALTLNNEYIALDTEASQTLRIVSWKAPIRTPLKQTPPGGK